MDMDEDDRIFPNIIRTILANFFPCKMLLNLYAMIILLLDIAWICAYTIFAIFRTACETIRPPPLKNLDEETVLVIGSGRGIGRDLAIQVALLGAKKVICVDINKENNEETVRLAKNQGADVVSYICDITKKNNVSNLALRLRNDIGFISMVFYCCGIPSARSVLSQPPEDVHETLDLTLTSYFWIVDSFLPSMKKKNHGHIVALTSVAGLSQVKHHLPLSVAQFAVQGLAESLMEDLRVSKKENVHVTLVHIYPFIVSGDTASDIRLRIPSYFGTITAKKAAIAILDSVRRNYIEVSIPKHFLFLGHLLRILPRKATVLLRELLDTGVDFA